ncbi:MAG: sulfatase-like hydrolase/transferase [Bacteroidetes bacterium]|nr:sulfatase-like hydrolase/transferase [Bacteroidota bacterium]
MGKYLLLPLVVVFGFLHPSCNKIEVGKGPFSIESNENHIDGKQEYLDAVPMEERGENRPNILLILVDDLGRDDISIYNQEGVKTPNLSRLARSGVTFTNAYSTSSVCSPSRASLLTGRYQHRFGFERQPMNRYPKNRLEYIIVDRFINTEPMRLVNPMSAPSREDIQNQGIPPGEILLPEILQASGYHTGIFGKWHLGFSDSFLPNSRGFDYQYGFYEAFTYYSLPGDPEIINHRHDYFASRHIWRQKRKGSCAIRVNDSVIAEKDYLTFSIANQTIDFIAQHDEEPFFAYAAFNAPHTPFQVPVEYYKRFDHIEDENKRAYYGMIAALDDGIGLIFDKLEEDGMLENTLILFASDNGAASYTGASDNGSLNGGKMTHFDGGVNVPCMISWMDKLPSDTIYNQPVSLMDLFVTALASSGIKEPPDRMIDGIDLMPYLNGQKDGSPHKALFWRTDFNKSLRQENWKLIWNTRDNQVFLFDLATDKAEEINLAPTHADLVVKLINEIILWEQELKEPAWPGVMEIRFEINGEETWWAI